jgi:transposase
MRPYSKDLRDRVAATVDQGEGSLRQIALRFLVSLSFVACLLRRRRQTGCLDPAPHGGGQPPAFTPADLERLRQWVHDQPDATLTELRQQLGIDCSLMAVWRALRQLKITRKKKGLHAEQRDTPKVQQKRAEFRATVATIAPGRLVFVDESGATTALTRTYARAPRGQRVGGAVPGQWESMTLICALRLSGVEAPVVFQGSTDTVTFQAYVEQALVPQLRPEDVVIWDNLKPHKAAQVLRAVEKAGARVVPLPPYSPDLTPIEKMFSKLKQSLRSAAARTTEGLTEAIGSGLRGVSTQDILGWFGSCGLVPDPRSRSPDQRSRRRRVTRSPSLCATQA